MFCNVKRLFDIIVSCAALILLGPLLLLLAGCVILSAGRPALYRGWRTGRCGVPFKIIKLRTMVPDAERHGGAETPGDDPRIHTTGKILRHYKLDELPQLLNVAMGDMSIVGPRPEVTEETRLYGFREKGLVSMRPGLTDWASVKFRHEAEILRGAPDPHEAYHVLIQPEKIRLGLKYTQGHSMVVDLRIICSTCLAICRGTCQEHG